MENETEAVTVKEDESYGFETVGSDPIGSAVIRLTSKMDEVLAICALMDLNYKTGLNQMTLINQQLANIYSILLVQSKPPPPSGRGTVEASESPIGTPLQIANKVKLVQPVEAPKPPAKKTKPDVIRKYPIEQKILYPDGKKVAMAAFTITGPLTKIEGKTNMLGKWNANLAPGQYDVTVVKYGTDEKPAINLAYKIDVVAGGPVELPDRKAIDG
jgi:hypothetical protein